MNDIKRKCIKNKRFGTQTGKVQALGIEKGFAKIIFTLVTIFVTMFALKKYLQVI